MWQNMERANVIYQILLFTFHNIVFNIKLNLYGHYFKFNKCMTISLLLNVNY